MVTLDGLIDHKGMEFRETFPILIEIYSITDPTIENGVATTVGNTITTSLTVFLITRFNVLLVFLMATKVGFVQRIVDRNLAKKKGLL